MSVAPELPPLEDCPRAPAERPGGSRVGQLDHVDLRIDLATGMWALGEPAGQAEIRAWLRRDDGADASVLDLLVFADALPPVTFDLGLMGWVPTVELTVHVRALPAPGWIRAVQRARLLQDGWIDEECELWDSAGRLVCQARQLAGYRVPDGHVLPRARLTDRPARSGCDHLISATQRYDAPARRPVSSRLGRSSAVRRRQLVRAWCRPRRDAAECGWGRARRTCRGARAGRGRASRRRAAPGWAARARGRPGRR